MTSRKPAHLLLVDDDPGLLKLLGMRLVSEGYSVVTAESGLEGLKILSREKIDLVISDLRMDEMDGLQLFRGDPEAAAGYARDYPDRARVDPGCGCRDAAGGVQLPDQAGGQRRTV